MKVFISWSTRRSHDVGEALEEWLKEVDEALAQKSPGRGRIRPWLSDKDMEVGARVQEELEKGLKDARVAILCMTVENIEKPWLVFEAGAIANQIVNIKRVCPYAVDKKIRSANLPDPLQHFTYAQSDKDGTKKLLSAINRALGDTRYDDAAVTEVFEATWPALEERVKPLRKDDVEPWKAQEVADLYRAVACEYTDVRRHLDLHRMSLSDELIPLIVEAVGGYDRSQDEAAGGVAEAQLADIIEKARLIIRRAQGEFDIDTRLVGNVRNFLRRNFKEATLEEVVRKKLWPVLESWPGDDVDKTVELIQRYKLVRDVVFYRFFKLLADALDKYVCKDEGRATARAGGKKAAARAAKRRPRRAGRTQPT